MDTSQASQKPTLGKITTALLVLVALIYANLAHAVVNYPASSSLGSQSVRSVHLQDGTILEQDIATTSAFSFVDFTIHDATVGTLTATSTASLQAGVQVGGDITADADGSHSIGAAGTRFANVYADTLHGDGANITGIETNVNVSLPFATTTPACTALAVQPKNTFFDDFDRANSNTVGNGWSEKLGGSNPDAERIESNRLIFGDGTNDNAAITRSQDPNEYPVRLHAIMHIETTGLNNGFNIFAFAEEQPSNDYGIQASVTEGSSNNVSVFDELGNTGTGSFTITTATDYWVWLDLWQNGSSTDAQLFLSTTSTKPGTPTVSKTHLDTESQHITGVHAQTTGTGKLQVDNFQYTQGDNGTSTNTFVIAAGADNATSTNQFIGFNSEAVSEDESAAATVVGEVSCFSGLTAGRRHFLSNTAGEIADTAGTNELVVGRASATTTLIIGN